MPESQSATSRSATPPAATSPSTTPPIAASPSTTPPAATSPSTTPPIATSPSTTPPAAATPSTTSTEAPNRAFRVGVAGPVGTGKSSLIALLCTQLADTLSLVVVTNDIYTDEDARFL
ncbi:MAG: hypothetical protein LBO75_04980, partial [Bifidobacteriaceae bacterium]|nr:hypothetical protein [Bifidobacteriaceae bacterium]